MKANVRWTRLCSLFVLLPLMFAACGGGGGSSSGQGKVVHVLVGYKTTCPARTRRLLPLSKQRRMPLLPLLQVHGFHLKSHWEV